jgi:hypothetical protein
MNEEKVKLLDYGQEKVFKSIVKTERERERESLCCFFLLLVFSCYVFFFSCDVSYWL